MNNAGSRPHDLVKNATGFRQENCSLQLVVSCILLILIHSHHHSSNLLTISHAETIAFLTPFYHIFRFRFFFIYCCAINHPGIIYEYLVYTKFYVSICGC